MGALHLPLYAGLLFVGRTQAPQPGASSHLGLGMRGGSHSPSSSSSQSSGCFASARQRGTVNPCQAARHLRDLRVHIVTKASFD